MHRECQQKCCGILSPKMKAAATLKSHLPFWGEEHVKPPEGVTKLLLDEMRDVYSLLESLQQRYRVMEEWLWNCYRTKEGERECNLKSGGYRTTRIYYNSNKSKRRGSARNCNWCGRSGHVEENCWIKKGACPLCGSDDHTRMACPKYLPRLRVRLLLSNCSTCTSESSVFSDVPFSREVTCPSQQFESLDSTLCISKDGSQRSSSMNEYVSNRQRKVPEKIDHSSSCTSKESIPDYVLNDSLIFSSQLGIRNSDYYRLYPMDEDEKQSGVTDTLQGNVQCSTGGLADGGLVLTAQDETWDVSSIEHSDDLGQTLVYNDESVGGEQLHMEERLRGSANDRGTVTIGVKCAPEEKIKISFPDISGSQSAGKGKERRQTSSWWWTDGFAEKVDGRSSII